MGRGKIQIKRIENMTNRQVTYSKRKKGIIKKAQEISVLCDTQVSLVIFSSAGNMGEFCSPKTTMDAILTRYQNSTGTQMWNAKHEYLKQEKERIEKENGRLQLRLRQLKGEDITSLKPEELIEIENILEDGLTNIRNKQMDCLKDLTKNTRVLEEKNQNMACILHQQMGVYGGETEDLLNKYAPKSIPIAFHVQPLHPNLQEMK